MAIELKDAIDLLRKLRLSLEDISNFEETAKSYLSAQKQSFLHRHLHNEILENTINNFVEENSRLTKKLKSRKIQLPIEQHKDLKEDKKHLAETIFKLRKDISAEKENLEKQNRQTIDIDQESKSLDRKIRHNVPTSLNALKLYEIIAELDINQNGVCLVKNGDKTIKIDGAVGEYEKSDMIWSVLKDSK